MSRYIATMTLKGLPVVLKVGTREECWEAIGIVANTPGITKIGMERMKGEDNHERRQ